MLTASTALSLQLMHAVVRLNHICLSLEPSDMPLSVLPAVQVFTMSSPELLTEARQ